MMRTRLAGFDNKREPDLSARECFLFAVEEHWQPSPLSTLPVQDVIPWLSSLDRQWPVWFDELSSDSSPDACAARAALDGWRNSYPLSSLDTWIMDAAIQSIGWSLVYERPVEWSYTPRKHPSQTGQGPLWNFSIVLDCRLDGVDEKSGNLVPGSARAPKELHNELDRK